MVKPGTKASDGKALEILNAYELPHQRQVICLVLEKIQFSTVEGFIEENALIWVQIIISVASDVTAIYLGFFFVILSKSFKVVFLKIRKFPLTCIFL